MSDPESIYICPERTTDTCSQVLRGISEQRISNYAVLDLLGQAASHSVIEGYESLADRHKSWGRQEAILSLRKVFESVAIARYNAVNPSTRLVCTGRTLIRNACSAKIDQA